MRSKSDKPGHGGYDFQKQLGFNKKNLRREQQQGDAHTRARIDRQPKTANKKGLYAKGNKRLPSCDKFEGNWKMAHNRRRVLYAQLNPYVKCTKLI